MVTPRSSRSDADVLPEVGAALRVEARSSARRGTRAAASASARARRRSAGAGRRRAPVSARPSRPPRSRRGAQLGDARLRRPPCDMPCRRACMTSSSPTRVPGGRGRADLGDVADAAADLARTRAARSAPATVAVPAVGVEQRGEHPQRRRLAGAVGAEQADDLAGGDVEVDARDGVDRSGLGGERSGEAASGDHGRSSWSRLSTPIVVKLDYDANRRGPAMRSSSNW